MKVTYNIKNIETTLENAKLALVDTAEALRTDLVQSQTVPKDQGDLEGDMFVDDTQKIRGVVKIQNPSVYSRKIYFDPEIHIKQGKNPNAKQYWFEDYISGSKKDLPIKYFKQMLKRRNGQ